MDVLISVSTSKMVKVRIPTDVIAARDKLVSDGCCLGCKRKFVGQEKQTRGQCQSCYQGTIRTVRSGDITIEELIREGRLLERSRPGRKSANPYLQELADRA